MPPGETLSPGTEGREVTVGAQLTAGDETGDLGLETEGKGKQSSGFPGRGGQEVPRECL